ncbi:polysaccharide deacetylase family protein [Flavobacterium arcticum]|uniref:Polysaccharide deacetylase family protein n=1 Tax=Flavobacterium arcticum TaxID=1784713 RepID=A0A345HA04_9FLAO|nr:polysaccharide deacetylase family protein [Flavobacterium arcticum]AXG73414.1 polysaccharide deacetylase family protein [Flavobacterium arcticum]KAF2513201.1 polysaccharide deacetylase family protein [Flavobacterium arcticum]
MKMYWVKTRWFIKRLFSGFVWDIPNTSKTVYLTFDDGPTPEITEWVLDILRPHDIKATFFCIGNNIEKHPDIFNKIITEGHAIGNHTFNHLNGWNTNNATYIDNIEATETAILKRNPEFEKVKLFRPPYGKMKRTQAKYVRSKGYRIIMWDVLSADFDKSISPEKCFKNVVNTTREGSVIIFHDSIKAATNMQYALPLVINYLKEKGFRFAKIS